MRHTPFGALVVVALSAGCSSSTLDSGGGAGTTANARTTGAGGFTATPASPWATGGFCGTNTAPESGVSCNTVVPSGNCTAAGFYTAAAPAPAGGTILPGTYDLYSMEAHWLRPDSGSSDVELWREEAMVVTGSGAALVAEVGQRWNTSTQRANYTLAASGTQLTFTQTCPVPGGGGAATRVVDYTATGSTLLLIEQHSSGIVVSTYLRRGG